MKTSLRKKAVCALVKYYAAILEQKDSSNRKRDHAAGKLVMLMENYPALIHDRKELKMLQVALSDKLRGERIRSRRKDLLSTVSIRKSNYNKKDVEELLAQQAPVKLGKKDKAIAEAHRPVKDGSRWNGLAS